MRCCLLQQERWGGCSLLSKVSLFQCHHNHLQAIEVRRVKDFALSFSICRNFARYNMHVTQLGVDFMERKVILIGNVVFLQTIVAKGAFK